MACPDEKMAAGTVDNTPAGESGSSQQTGSGTAPGAAETPPVKRRRGRPRKHPLPEASAPDTAPPGSDTRTAPAGKGVLGNVRVPASPGSAGQALAAIGPGPTGASPTPIKRPRGRPRKHPLPDVAAPGAPAAAPPASPAGPASSAAGTVRGIVQVAGAEAAGAFLGVTPAGMPALPIKRPRGRPRKHPLAELLPGVTGGVVVPAAGAVAATRRASRAGRRPKREPSITNPFCPDCGTYLRVFKPARGRNRVVCPRCEPDRMIQKRDYRDYIDRTGMPCKDRGKCRPERCIKALDCEEMQRII